MNQTDSEVRLIVTLTSLLLMFGTIGAVVLLRNILHVWHHYQEREYELGKILIKSLVAGYGLLFLVVIGSVIYRLEIVTNGYLEIVFVLTLIYTFISWWGAIRLEAWFRG